jgi:hypothetical protein
MFAYVLHTVIPTFPVLHRATFVFRDYMPPLLLNAIAIGSLYLGPKDVVAKVSNSRHNPTDYVQYAKPVHSRERFYGGWRIQPSRPR